MILKEFFRIYEEKLNLNGKQIAEEVGISTALYSLIKTGKKPMTTELVDKFAILFHLSNDEHVALYLISFESTKSIKVNSNSIMYDYIINLIKQNIKE